MSELLRPLDSVQAPQKDLARIESKARDQAKLEEAAKEFESVFFDMVMKSMRETVGESEVFGDSSKTKMFQQMLDSEYSKLASEKSGHNPTSLSAAIVRQLSRKFTNPHEGASGIE